MDTLGLWVRSQTECSENAERRERRIRRSSERRWFAWSGRGRTPCELSSESGPSNQTIRIWVNQGYPRPVAGHIWGALCPCRAGSRRCLWAANGWPVSCARPAFPGHTPQTTDLHHQAESRSGSTDLARREFTADGPDRVWVLDLERHEAFPNRAVVRGHRLVLVAAGALKLRAA